MSLGEDRDHTVGCYGCGLGGRGLEGRSLHLFAALMDADSADSAASASHRSRYL
jgi:hypothetical protein